MDETTGVAMPQIEQVIGTEQVREAMQTLNDYKGGKGNLENRIIEDERWYMLRHWEYLRGKSGADMEPTSGWLFNVIANKHADAMDNFPQPNIYAREQSDEEAAKTLSDVIPCVLERADFEQTYSDNWWEKLKHGASVYSIVWDKEAENGLGDVAVRMVDPLNIYWEPGISDIQKSRNLFHVGLQDTDLLEQQYPDLRGKLDGQSFTMARYQYDESIDTSEKSVVVDWYYKRKIGTKTVLHYCQFVGDYVIYATENDPARREIGWYDHGQYPFVFDVLYPEKGTPFGFGFVAVCKDPQMYIDRLSGNILENTAMATRPRYFAQDNNAINSDDFMDGKKRIIPVSGSLDDLHIRKVDVDPVDGNSISVLQMKIDEMKETSGNRDVTAGSSGSGVTAASAIAALQEAGNKGSRDMIAGAYRAYIKVNYQVLELIRQFYDTARYFRIVSPNDGAVSYQEFSNQAIMPQQTGMIGDVITYRKPVFDIKITAQKRSSVAREVENQRATEMYQMGFFNPERAQEAMIALDMMEFEGKEKVLQQVQQGQTLMNLIQQMSAQMQQMAALLGATVGGGGEQNEASGSGTAPSKDTLGGKTAQAMTANAMPYANQIVGASS